MSTSDLTRELECVLGDINIKISNPKKKSSDQVLLPKRRGKIERKKKKSI